MATQNTINLLKTNHNLSPVAVSWENKARLASVVLLVVLLVIGLGVAGGYVYLKNQQQDLTAKKRQLTVQIDAQTTKLVLLGALKNRLTILKRITDSERNWSRIVSDIGTVAQPPLLQGIVIGEKQDVIVSFESRSLDEIASFIRGIASLVENKKGKNPQLVNFEISEDGMIQLSISYTPVVTL